MIEVLDSWEGRSGSSTLTIPVSGVERNDLLVVVTFTAGSSLGNTPSDDADNEYVKRAQTTPSATFTETVSIADCIVDESPTEVYVSNTLGGGLDVAAVVLRVAHDGTAWTDPTGGSTYVSMLNQTADDPTSNTVLIGSSLVEEFPDSGAILLVGGLTHDGATTTLAPQSGWTEAEEEEDASGGIPYSVVHRVMTSGGLHSHQWTTGASRDYSMALAGYTERLPALIEAQVTTDPSPVASGETITVQGALQYFPDPAERTFHVLAQPDIDTFVPDLFNSELLRVIERDEFPSTPVLDTFNRSNEGPLMTGWGAQRSSGLKVLSNQCAPNDTDDNGAYWTTSLADRDVEAYVTIPVLHDANGSVSLYARLSPDSVHHGSGYRLRYGDEVPSNISLRRYDAGVETILRKFDPYQLDAGDKIGIRCVGRRIEAWAHTDGDWTRVGFEIDETYLGDSPNNKIGLHINVFGASPVARLDDFGGGVASAEWTIERGQADSISQPIDTTEGPWKVCWDHMLDNPPDLLAYCAARAREQIPTEFTTQGVSTADAAADAATALAAAGAAQTDATAALADAATAQGEVDALEIVVAGLGDQEAFDYEFVVPFNPVFSQVVGGTVNQAYLQYMIVPREIVVASVDVFIGATAGNIDVGIYEGDVTGTLTRLWSRGSIASPGNGMQNIAISAGSPTSLTLAPGVYWVAVSMSSNTISFRGSSASTLEGTGYRKTASHALPSTLSSLTENTTQLTPWVRLRQ